VWDYDIEAVGRATLKNHNQPLALRDLFRCHYSSAQERGEHRSSNQRQRSVFHEDASCGHK
jgi:hypothetical protein